VRFSIIVSCVLGIVLGGSLVWGHGRLCPSVEPKALPISASTTPVQVLLDALAKDAQSGNADALARRTQALASLGSEALPEVRQRLQYDNLPTEVLAAYASALIEVGREPILPELRVFWGSPRACGEGLRIKQPVILALSKRRSPEAGKFLLDLWLEESDAGVQTLIAQAIKTNPQVNGPIVTEAWQRTQDPIVSQRLMELAMEFGATANQQAEGQALFAMDVGTPEALKKLQDVLDRAGTANKTLALGLLEKRGDAEALKTMLTYVKGAQVDPGSRSQALTGYCRKADTKQGSELTMWFPVAGAAIQSEILNAVGQSGNSAFLPWVSSLSGPQAKRAQDLLQMAENRRKVGLKP